MSKNKKKKEYSLDELGELIVPHRLTKSESEEIRLFIANYRQRIKSEKARSSRRKVTS